MRFCGMNDVIGAINANANGMASAVPARVDNDRPIGQHLLPRALPATRTRRGLAAKLVGPLRSSLVSGNPPTLTHIQHQRRGGERRHDPERRAVLAAQRRRDPVPGASAIKPRWKCCRLPEPAGAFGPFDASPVVAA